MLIIAAGILIAAFVILALSALAFYGLFRVANASEPPSQFVLKALWCIGRPLDKLIRFKPTWYVCRAIIAPIVGVFGYTVDGIPGKEFFIDITKKQK
jgi:hypothetical protein